MYKSSTLEKPQTEEFTEVFVKLAELKFTVVNKNTVD